MRNARAYHSVDEFMHDLQIIDRNLRENKGVRIAEGRLADLIRNVEVFGFHLATLDVRQHSSRHHAAVAEVYNHYGIYSDYNALAEPDKVRVLTGEILNLRPFTAQLVFSEETNESVRLFRLIRRAKDEIDEDAIQTYIISMTSSISNMLEVLLLAKTRGCWDGSTSCHCSKLWPTWTMRLRSWPPFSRMMLTASTLTCATGASRS